MRSIVLLALSFVVMSVSTLVLGNARKAFETKQPSVLSETKEVETVYETRPTLQGGTVYPTFSAQAVLAIDMDSGVTLYEKNPDAKFLPASTTKITTALVAMDNYDLDAVLVVGNLNVDGQKMNLISGEKISVENLLYGLLIYSANDAAEVLAQNYPGGREKFVDAMNAKADELGLQNSHYENPTGFDGASQVTSARDLIKLSEIAMNRPFFRKVVGTKGISVSDIEGTIVHRLENINELVGEVSGVKGVKTGWTENARENLVTYLERESLQEIQSGKYRRVMIAILGSQNRFGETRQLIDWIFSNFKWEEIQVSR